MSNQLDDLRFPLANEEELHEWLRKTKFRKQIFGGVSERDVWLKIGELNEMYQKALVAERGMHLPGHGLMFYYLVALMAFSAFLCLHSQHLQTLLQQCLVVGVTDTLYEQHFQVIALGVCHLIAPLRIHYILHPYNRRRIFRSPMCPGMQEH